jgi:hypothetical protein
MPEAEAPPRRRSSGSAKAAAPKRGVEDRAGRGVPAIVAGDARRAWLPGSAGDAAEPGEGSAGMGLLIESPVEAYS